MAKWRNANSNQGKKKSKQMGVYTSFSARRKYRNEQKTREKAKKMERLPKNPVKRFFAHFQWRRIRAYWFSKAGLKRIGKIFLACFLIGVIALGALFLYYKNQLNSIQLDEINVASTINTYLDRNGEVLWEDRGDGNYRLVVDGSEISTYMRQATVAIEDRNFYNHSGVDFAGVTRAAISTLTGRGVQGGSTLTQQLIKQIYFSDEAASANRGGIARKVKEMILAIELEKMYDKEKIITMYLNESPYGGRRNGVESAAQTYFGKPAKELTLAESALLAAIPNNPAILNPYNIEGNEALIERQHKTLDVMVELGYITAEQATEAKNVPILDQIKPESAQYVDMKAPHFVLEVKKQLEEKYGLQAMRSGGYTIKTTLDLRAQQLAEEAITTGSKYFNLNRSDNLAMASVDVETGQVIAMMGSVSWDKPIYGEVNAATSPLEPGSTIKPILDYSALFQQREGINYGPGSILRDENIDSIYCAGYVGSCTLRNSSGAFYGNITIRQSLGNSLNIAAVKALYINGIENSLEVAHKLGDKSYCADNENAGLSMAIGSGCNVKLVEHANAFASLARGGKSKELAYVLEIKDSTGKVIESWTDDTEEQVVDEQVAYMLSNIMSDPNARTITFGSQARSFGFVVPGVWTASKTGTTTTTSSMITKDSWFASYSTAVSTVVWNGNHDGSGLASNTNEVVRRVIDAYMSKVHTDIYANEGKWKSGDQPKQPAGIQTLYVNGVKDIWPSWYNSRTAAPNNSATTSTVYMEFNKYTHTLASNCTPAEQRVQVAVTKTVDPITKKELLSAPEPYDANNRDNCSYRPPAVSIYRSGEGIRVAITAGSQSLANYELTVDGTVVESGAVSGTSFDTRYRISESNQTAQIKITDALGYEVMSETINLK